MKLHDLKMHYEKLAFESRGLRFKADEIESILPRPRGEVKAIEDYVSVQYHFPRIYGLGPRGVPDSAGPEAKARARQLRAYLLLFDQHMVDYLAMLGNLRRLFSTERVREQTYSPSAERRQLSGDIGDLRSLCDRTTEAFVRDLPPRRPDETSYRLPALYGESYRDDILRLSPHLFRQHQVEHHTGYAGAERRVHEAPGPHHEKEHSGKKKTSPRRSPFLMRASIT